MSGPRIALITREWPDGTGESGGIGTYFRNLAVGLARCGAAPVVITGPAARNGPVPHYDFPVIHLAEPKLGIARRIVERLAPHPASYQAAVFQHALLRRAALRDELPPILAEHGIEVAVGPLWAGELADLSQHTGVPVVLRASGLLRRVAQANGDKLDHHGRQVDRLEQRALQTCSSLYAPSAAALRDLLDCAATPDVPHAVIPSGVDCDRFFPSAAAKQAGRCRFLFVGRLEPQKGMGLLAAVAPAVLAQVPHAEFWFVGRDTPTAPDGGTWESYLAERVPESRAHRLRFWGRRSWDRLPDLYRDCDCLMVPSSRDRLPNAAIEALACGLPVVASAAAGLGEVIHPDHNGVILHAHHPEAWLEALLGLAAHPCHVRDMGARARRFAESNLSLTAVARPVIDLCRQAVRHCDRYGLPMSAAPEGQPA